MNTTTINTTTDDVSYNDYDVIEYTPYEIWEYLSVNFLSLKEAGRVASTCTVLHAYFNEGEENTILTRTLESDMAVKSIYEICKELMDSMVPEGLGELDRVKQSWDSYQSHDPQSEANIEQLERRFDFIKLLSDAKDLLNNPTRMIMLPQLKILFGVLLYDYYGSTVTAVDCPVKAFMNNSYYIGKYGDAATRFKKGLEAATTRDARDRCLKTFINKLEATQRNGDKHE